MIHATLTVASKEIRDHLRDRRSLVSTMSYALIGPAAVALVAMSRPATSAPGERMLLSMASVFALVSAFAGGMNVALDAMAGERERHSLVPLLLTPASRRAVVIGKWIATVCFGLLSVLFTVAGCAAALAGTSASAGLSTPVSSVVTWIGAGLVPLVLLGSACHLVVAGYSASTKEAHTWMSSLVFVPMLAGMSVVFAPAAGEGWWPFAPLVGQQMWITRTLAGQGVSATDAGVLAAITIAASVTALELARRVLGRDDLLTI